MIRKPFASDREDFHYSSGSIYAFSTRQYRINDQTFPYAWNHTLSYNAALGIMPHLVQMMKVRRLKVHTKKHQDQVHIGLESSVVKGKHKTHTFIILHVLIYYMNKTIVLNMTMSVMHTKHFSRFAILSECLIITGQFWTLISSLLIVEG